jgi:hypothetical protein
MQYEKNNRLSPRDKHIKMKQFLFTAHKITFSTQHDERASKIHKNEQPVQQAVHGQPNHAALAFSVKR